MNFHYQRAPASIHLQVFIPSQMGTASLSQSLSSSLSTVPTLAQDTIICIWTATAGSKQSLLIALRYFLHKSQNDFWIYRSGHFITLFEIVSCCNKIQRPHCVPYCPLWSCTSLAFQPHIGLFSPCSLRSSHILCPWHTDQFSVESGTYYIFWDWINKVGSSKVKENELYM